MDADTLTHWRKTIKKSLSYLAGIPIPEVVNLTAKTVFDRLEYNMPLLDHFHPPLELQYPWESFHSSWATRIADALNEQLPPEFLAAEHIHAGPSVEIDVAALERTGLQMSPPGNGARTATLETETWAPPAPTQTMPALFSESFEVRVYSTTGGLSLVGAIELITPGNKDRPEERKAFGVKCASYLQQGVSLIIIDIVTVRRSNLHNEIIRLMVDADDFLLPNELSLYAVAYRPAQRQEKSEIDIWSKRLAIGDPLPVLPLRLTGDFFVPVDLESTYTEACRKRRLTS